MSDPNQDWKIFRGDHRDPHDGIDRLPKAPSWRPFGTDISPGVSRRKRRGETFQVRPEEVEMVNAALYLRRPLLITGKPGTGKSSLAYAVARELNLGEVLYWPITTRTTLKDGLYSYDAIGRLQEVKQSEAKGEQVDDPQKIANYITLGPLGTALLPSSRPRILIIDEIDKSDIDLPNDLLTIFEEGRFEIPELARLEPDET
ncbi:AAA family ATPase, partial [filamentous cyanobacterium CCP1]